MKEQNYKSLKRSINLIEKELKTEVEKLKSIDKERWEFDIATKCIVRYLTNHQDPKMFFEKILSLVVRESKAQKFINSKKNILEMIQAMKTLEETSKDDKEFAEKVAKFIIGFKHDILDRYMISECALENIGVACDVIAYKICLADESRTISEKQGYYLTYKIGVSKSDVEDALDYICFCESSINEATGKSEHTDGEDVSEDIDDTDSFDQNFF